MSKNFAHLRKECPFYPIFQNGFAPIKNILIPSRVALEGSDENEAYMLDWSKCSEEQQKQIARLVTSLRGGSYNEFLKYMDSGGDMPIRLSQTTGCSTDVPFFLE